jgi:hypothetical protein
LVGVVEERSLLNRGLLAQVPNIHHFKLVDSPSLAATRLHLEILLMTRLHQDPAISQMVHPHQKLVEYEEEASVLHQRLVMILQGLSSNE